jgi:hypothetical protein
MFVAAVLSKLPAWLKAAPKELDKLILEQQYSKAAKLIAKVLRRQPCNLRSRPIRSRSSHEGLPLSL